MNILHLASFSGNIGDYANISSVQRALRLAIPEDIVFTNLEMREFYWKLRSFDASFASLANQHDALIIGGGNYFELWVEHSFSGMSVDISFEILEQIKVPIIFFALGCDASMGYSANTVEKAKRYFDYLLAKPNSYLVSVRNDGSQETIGRLFGPDYAEKIQKVPDGGFFISPHTAAHPYIRFGKPTIAINLAGDSLNLRFAEKNETASPEESLQQLASCIHGLFKEYGDALSLIFVPHIFKDLDIISRLLFLVKDWYVRRNCFVAPYTQGWTEADCLFDLYRKCDLVLGMRFHANVCPIGMGVPSIGLATYPQVKYLYEELGLHGRVIDISRSDFSTDLVKTAVSSIEQQTTIRAAYQTVSKKLKTDFSGFLSFVKTWVEKNIRT